MIQILKIIYIINKTNWICDETYNDVFEITIKDGICTCKRLDSNTGWGMELLININILPSLNPTTLPIFFINLEKDKDRLQFIKNILYDIFDNNNIFRVEGVKHEIGLEGCRLAHINAHITAINKGVDYYLISEDDVQSLVDKPEIIKYINNTLVFNPDLVLFEQGQNLEQNINLCKITDNMYRIFNGGNNAGFYLCSKNFGIKLIKHWLKHANRHIDHSWQDLWKSNNIYFHKPQLFHQREGYSNQNDVDYRETTKPFDWDLYEKVNKFLLKS